MFNIFVLNIITAMVIVSIRQNDFVSKLTFEFLLSLLDCIWELYIVMSKHFKSNLMSITAVLNLWSEALRGVRDTHVRGLRQP